MSKPKVKIKVKKGRGKHPPTKIKARLKGTPYIGGEAAREKARADMEKARADSLQRQLDSIQCQIRINIKEQK